jgi:hypothetical protein
MVWYIYEEKPEKIICQHVSDFLFQPIKVNGIVFGMIIGWKIPDGRYPAVVRPPPALDGTTKS